MHMVLSHDGIRVQTLKQPDKHGREIAVSLPEASFELSRARTESLISMLLMALDATSDKSAKRDVFASPFVRPQAGG